MMISPPPTSSHSSFTQAALISTQSLPASPVPSPPRSSTVPSTEPPIVPNTVQPSTLNNQTDHASTSRGSVHRPSRYLHTDPLLNAELKFYDEGQLWVLSYYRRDQQVGSSLYQSRATAELLLKSLGYKPDESREETA